MEKIGVKGYKVFNHDWTCRPAETTGSYLKKEDLSEERTKWWEELTEDDKKAITSLPNFDPEIFEEITGIDVGKQ